MKRAYFTAKIRSGNRKVFVCVCVCVICLVESGILEVII